MARAKKEEIIDTTAMAEDIVANVAADIAAEDGANTEADIYPHMEEYSNDADGEVISGDEFLGEDDEPEDSALNNGEGDRTAFSPEAELLNIEQEGEQPTSSPEAPPPER